MSVNEKIMEKLDTMSYETREKALAIITILAEKSEFPDTLEEYMRQKGWNGERVHVDEVDWGGFVGEEVPW
ncbi:MAG: hypothetical protein LBM41_02910 [Ruminococcus sp.]|jgi:hypothetical protein|nr:hypothetical protein [Ruminococcus sp.]